MLALSSGLVCLISNRTEMGSSAAVWPSASRSAAKSGLLLMNRRMDLNIVDTP
jgi:hypothetical protein